MGQKVNPISLRLEKTNRHFDSCWYDDYNYTDLLLQDYKINNYLKTVLDQIQYPEGRLLIENLPKKTNLNLFYYNPTNSRRKKNKIFQLQDFRESKSKQRMYKNQNRIRFQQGIERKELWKNSYRKVDCRFFGRDWKGSQRSGNSWQHKTFLGNESLQGLKIDCTSSQPTKSVNSLSVPFGGFSNPFLDQLPYRSGKSANLLNFVVQPKEIEKEWGRERFFVRYLLTLFYCKSLQNKRYTLHNNLYAINSLCNPIALSQEKERTKRKEIRSGRRFSKSHLELSLSKGYSTLFNLFFFRALIGKQSALLLVQEIVYYLERKIPFRRIKLSLRRETPQYTCIKGIRISCSGRVGGRSKKAQRSKTQSVKIGQSSLGVFSCKIDFACKSAKTRFGLIGVKVWVCYQ